MQIFISIDNNDKDTEIKDPGNVIDRHIDTKMLSHRSHF